MKLNQEQEKIAYLRLSGHMAVKGIAGSGKTSCGIARVPFLVENLCYHPEDKVLLLTYNRTLVNYVKSIFKEFIRNRTTLFDLDEKKIEIKSIDQIFYYYYKNFSKKQGFDLEDKVEEHEINELLKEIIALYKRDYPNIKQIDESNLEFIKNEIKWIQNCNYMSEAEYQIADRSGISASNSDGPQKLTKNSEVRKVIFQIMVDFVKRFKEEKNKICFETIRIYGYREACKSMRKKYTHIIIDEAQDLSKIQLELIKNLYSRKDYGSIMFLYDGTQSIYEQAWIGKGRSFKSIGFDMAGKGRTLTKNFRTTTQISQAAFSLISNYEDITKDEHYLEPKLIDRQGAFPIYKKLDNFKEQVYYIKNLIECDLRDIPKNNIVITARNSDILKELSLELNTMGISSIFLDKTIEEFNEDRIKLITLHSIKGLESKVVIMASCNNGIIPFYNSNDEDSIKEQEIIERKLFYVGMTRATEKLYIIAWGQESKFLKDINKDYLLFDKGMKIKALYNISIEHFYFTEKINNLHRAEEKVRQWFIKELIETYGYKFENIDIEYQVKIGSKTGFADIVVYKNNGYKKIPYILVEVKKEGALVNSDRGQLESYCAVTPDCQYSILTDGKTINIFNKEFIPVSDIPEAINYDEYEKLKKYNYKSLSDNRVFEIIYNDEVYEKIEICENNKYTEYEMNEINKIPIIGKISAGYGIDMNYDDMGTIPMPARMSNDSFFLKVRGDSMIKADINHGDYALVKKGVQANSSDIVVCTLNNEEATLKRYFKSGNSLILFPENDEYESIMINPEDENIRIVGVVQGIIKE